MPVIKVDLKDFAKEMGDFSKASLAAQRKAVVRGLWRTLPYLVEQSPVDQGFYAQSWDVRETPKTVMIGNYAPHAAIVEFGTRPFTPPIGPLLAWAKRVLKDPSQPGAYSQSVWGLAKAAQASIAARGIIPRMVLQNAQQIMIDNVKREFNKL